MANVSYIFIIQVHVDRECIIIEYIGLYREPWPSSQEVGGSIPAATKICKV